MDDYEVLAERLRDAHARVASLGLPRDEKASVSRRLLVITEASKRSVTSALERLDSFMNELDAQHPSS
jgi:hypothetical protein